MEETGKRGWGLQKWLWFVLKETEKLTLKLPSHPLYNYKLEKYVKRLKITNFKRYSSGISTDP